jgi:hypothetical protein
MELTETGRFWRRVIKRFMYTQVALRDAVMILFGRTPPLVLFNVEADPPSIYINFRVRPDRLAALAELLDLPDGLELEPIRILEGEEPFHCITMNAYRVSGLVSGVRAEWSAFVRDAAGGPRYLVVEAQSDVGSVDPVNLVTLPGKMSHALEGDCLQTRITTENKRSFIASAQLPEPEAREEVRAAPEWIEANDLIYWRNGVCDRTFYDAALAQAPLWRVPLDGLQVDDQSVWNEFLEPEPVHAVLLSKRVQFAMSPWWNI